MPHQFAALVVTHDESTFGKRVFPKLAAIVKQNAGEQKIEIELRIERRDRHRDAHHLRGVLDQTTAPRVMIIAGRSRAAETLAEFLQKRVA